MKLEVGMYVRTKKGVFAKSKLDGWFGIGFDDNDKEMIEIDVFPNFILKEDIVKASHNIIDLIEVGDYVNGKQVIKINIDYIFDYTEEVKMIYFSDNDYIYSKTDIKSIVTKEQFESMSYKVGK